ncbi:MAG: bifunctional (p)ppGpp synthetase/guanosine-3',5'-bis(diphosphate) 3'-pyrophosphohydrolase [Gammaproteobacteria bacterium]|nr:bifunctional (p)ppGpp synthetase/guanosine-3',5'-bis(diphosphate) 3'-pyrophosphohydrolase [Gammaproteobacteria bacterium]
MASTDADEKRVADQPPAIEGNNHTERFLVSDLCSLLEKRLHSDQVSEVYRAYLLAAQAHDGQFRVSGEPYIYHPLAVARILAELNMDHGSIIAAILHDVLEDTPITKEELAEDFGAEVAHLVDGVSKLTHLKFESRLEAQAANFRKMVLAMVDDIRVVLIKLADRLHNMRTLGVMPTEKKRRIALETLEIYAPIANRLGIYSLKNELEELGFAAMNPLRYRVIKKAVRRVRGNRSALIQQVEEQVGARLADEGIEARVTGREKHTYSVYQKMRAKQLSFKEIYDMFAMRVVVDNVDACYRTLGVLHGWRKPVPGRFKDYIAIAKANGYQSLHTVLFGPNGTPLEVQIRTEEMDHFADSGIAAHWMYKAKNNGDIRINTREWLSGLLDMQRNADSSLEFLENVKVDLFPDEVYIFSPKGDIYQLPRNATVVDFAYAIHSDVGHRCVAAKIEHRLAPLRSKLQNGQTVEIITAAGSRPSPLWLNFTVTAKARTSILHYLKNMKTEEAISFGRRLLERALAAEFYSLEEFATERLLACAKEYGYQQLDGLYAEIGLGNRPASLVALQLLGNEKEGGEVLPNASCDLKPLMIEGGEGVVVTFARCCSPIPGDVIRGFLSKGRGVVVHRDNCRNITEYRHQGDKWVPVEWATECRGEFLVNVVVEVESRQGVLAKITFAVSELDANIENLSLEDRDGNTTLINFVLGVHGRQHLARVIRRLRKHPVVLRVRRS